MEAERFTRTDAVVPDHDLRLMIVWDDDENPDDELSCGVYIVCGGVWRREEGDQWRFWEDKAVADELNRFSL